MKLKECKICGTGFIPRSTMQKCCSWPCALIYSQEQDKRKEKAIARKQKKEFYETDRKHQLKLAQQAFNAFIRERDKSEPCISCGRYHEGQYHAGHFLTTGARPDLRFHPDNCHKQCAPCNNHLSGNVNLYHKALIKKAGYKIVEWFYTKPSSYKLTIDDIIEIKQYYKEQLKLLQ